MPFSIMKRRHEKGSVPCHFRREYSLFSICINYQMMAAPFRRAYDIVCPSFARLHPLPVQIR